MERWRILVADGLVDGVTAADGLATDEAMMLAHGRAALASREDGLDRRPRATLRLYSYRPSALVGRYQSLEDEVDLEACGELGLGVGRRPTGGGAILMGPDQLGVAVAAPARPEEAPREALKRYAGGVIAGLEELGVRAVFRSKNDLEVGGRKIAGLGLYLDPDGAILFHASILAGLDVPLMLRVLRIPGAKLSDKAVARVEDRVTTVGRELGRSMTAADLRPALAHGFERAFGVTLEEGRLGAAEEERRSELAAERYAAKEWILQRSPRRDARGSALLKTPAGLLRIYAGVHGGTLKSVLVTGDYNLPPAGVTELEAALKWSPADPERIAETAEATLDETALGVPPARVAAAVWEAAENAGRLAEAGHPLRREGSCYFPDPESVPGKTEVPRGGAR